MNSWKTTLNEYMRLFGYKYITGYNEEKISENYKIAVPDYINNFMKAVYTLGNFALVPGPGKPVDFNRKRNCKFKDYWDLTLLAIYEYYMGETGGEWICSLEKDPKAEEVIKNWLKRSEEPKDQNGWNNFVKVNFMDPFVKEIKKDKNGEVCWGKPCELWNGHFNGEKLPQNENQFKEFFESATKRILERGELIARALTEKNIKNKWLGSKK